MIIPIKRVLLVVNVRDEQIDPAVLLEIHRVHAHAGTGPASFGEGYSRNRADLFELSVATIHKKKVRHRVVGHKDVHVPVIVQIRGHRSPGFPWMLAYA